jgi:DNA invertase Pin-like site-specific DNA recombinase
MSHNLPLSDAPRLTQNFGREATTILTPGVTGLRGVGFKVLSGHGASIDKTIPAGKLVFGIFAALAEFERELISECTKAGLASARARGRTGGTP